MFLSSVKKNLTAADVISVFGHFVKFIVEPAGRPTGATNTVHVKNAFEVTMQCRLTVSTPCLPNLMEKKTKRDRMFDDLIQLAEEKGLKFHPDQLESGRPYVNTVCSALWYIDGHHGTLGLRGCN